MKKYYNLFKIFISATAELINTISIFSKVILLISIMIIFSPKSTSAQDGPDIAIWYGDVQSFAQQGVPQPWVNILGNVSDVDGVASLFYTLNGGSNVTLSIGPDGRRLQLSGDFNIDLATSDLIDGANSVIITASDNQGQSEHTVTVNYTITNVWPLPYDIDWQAPTTAVNSVSQAVDGNWEITPDGIHTVTTGYDRLVAIGDTTWDDYEISVPLTIHSIIGGNGVGVLLRWMGHTDNPVSCAQPKCGYLPLGAICWYRGNRLEIYGNNGDILATQTRSLDLETIYMFKARVETNPGIGGLYSFKVWKQSEAEPAGWDIVGQEEMSDPQYGSLMLISHHGDVTFGNLSISAIPISITNVQALVHSSNTGATISWNTSVPANSQVAYGLTSGYELGVVTDPTMETSHSLDLTGLLPDTEYHYQINSVTAEANEAYTGDLTFTTVTSDIVSDDFHLPLLNTSLWTYIDPVGDCDYDLVGSNTANAWLNFMLPAGTEHQLWESGLKVPHVLQSCNNADFEVEVKFESPLIQQFQEQGILVRQDDDRFMRFEFFSNGTETFVYVATLVSGSATTHADVSIGATGVVPLYLRVKRQSEQWTVSHSTDGVIWSQSAIFNFAITVTGVGPYAGNAVSGSSPAFTGSIDYFFNTASPVVPEDPISEDVVVITTAPVTASMIGQLYNYDVEADGTPAPTFSLLTAPTGMTIDGASGLIEWTPDAPGFFDVSVQASNIIPSVDIQDFVIHVVDNAGSAVSDDFNNLVLDEDVWSFIDPLDGGGYALTGTCTENAWINISVSGGLPHELWTDGIMAPHILQGSNDTDFELEVKFESSLSGTYQEQGILVKEDEANFIRFEFYSSGSDTKIIAATLTASSPSIFPLTSDIEFNGSIGTDGIAPLYMRINRTGNDWIQSYSFDGIIWNVATTFDHTLVVTAVGTYAGNAGSSPEHTSSVDYFFNNAAPASPEDANLNEWVGTIDNDWNNNDNWWCGNIPTATTNILIPTGLTNYPVINTIGAVCKDITIQSGASLEITESNTLAVGGNWVNDGNFIAKSSTLTFNGTIEIQSIGGISTTTFYGLTIDSGASLEINGTNAITVSGNWINNGSFTANNSLITFDGANALQTIGGSSTTTFYKLIVDLGDQTRILEALSLIALSSTSDPLLITSGTFKLSSASTIAPFTSNTGAVIPAIGGLWNNGGIINTNNSCTWTNRGIIRNTSGSLNIGVNSGNSLKYYSGSSFILEGGTVTIAGRFYPYSAAQTIDFNMLGGELKLVDVGFSSNLWASFDIPASGSSFTMSDGTIIIKNPNGNTTSPRDYRNEAGTVNITGGTVQFGTATTSGSPNFIVGDGSTISTLPNVTLVQVATATTVTLDSPIQILGNLLINSGTTMDANGEEIDITGNWTNAGGIYAPETNIITFSGITDQTVSGINTFYDFVLDKTTGDIILANDISISNVLTFKTTNLANISSGVNKLVVSNNASLAIDRQGSGHITGNIQRAITADVNSYLYPIGTSTAYAPATIDFAAGTVAGELIGSTFDGDHVNIGTSNVDPNSSVNRNWSLTINSGLTTANYDATFNWVNSDEDAGFDYSTAIVGEYSGTTWTYPTTGTLTATNTQIVNVTGFSNFQIGNSNCNQPDIPIAEATPSTICAGGNTTLSTLSGDLNDATDWQWYSGSCGGLSIGSGESIEVFPVNTTTYFVRGEGGCTTPRLCAEVVVTVNPTATISGYVTYYNTANTPLEAVELELQQSGYIDNFTTGSDGYYEFTGICPGDYEVEITYEAETGYINSTDAAQVNYWAVNPSSIEMTKFFAGDVNNDLYVTPADAGLIQQYFLTAGNAGPNYIPGWEFWAVGETISDNPGAGGKPAVTIFAGETAIPQNFYGLGSGDFNGSFTPGDKSSGNKSLSLIYGETIEIGIPEFELPIYAGIDMKVGAISLILNIPMDILEVQNVYLGNNPDKPILFSVLGEKLSISWQSISSVVFNSGEPLITLKLEILENLGKDEIKLSLIESPLNELANEQYDIIQNVTLIVDVIKPSMVGVTEEAHDKTISLNCFPNPFTESIQFEYSTPVDGKVLLEIYNMLGNRIKVITEETQSAGDYIIKSDDFVFQPGIYMAILKVENKNDLFTQTIKIIGK